MLGRAVIIGVEIVLHAGIFFAEAVSLTSGSVPDGGQRSVNTGPNTFLRSLPVAPQSLRCILTKCLLLRNEYSLVVNSGQRA
ncbi:hypothetical protein WM23_28245 [Burkholderia ubonensis]|nr:hypothetical protein WM23_28245 [Burkholderia ubonensis]